MRSLMSTAGMVAALVAVSAVSGYAGAKLAVGVQEPGTPITVVDVKEVMAEFRRNNPDMPQNEADASGLIKAFEIAEQLSDAGYVVLPSTSIMAAPQYVIIPEPAGAASE